MTHDQLQAQCWAWAWRACVQNWPHMLRRFFSVPNSAAGFLGPRKAGQMAACGMLAGVWDMPIYDDRGATHWVEFKVGKDKVSDAQKKFRTAMLPLGNQFFYVIHEDFNLFCRIFTAIVTKDDLTLQELSYDE